MKAQASVEFLLNFLLFLFLISALLAALSGLSSASEHFSSGIMEKMRMEEFARTLDISETIQHEKFLLPTDREISPFEDGILAEDENGSKARAIYGFGENHGEPV